MKPFLATNIIIKVIYSFLKEAITAAQKKSQMHDQATFINLAIG